MRRRASFSHVMVGTGIGHLQANQRNGVQLAAFQASSSANQRINESTTEFVTTLGVGRGSSIGLFVYWSIGLFALCILAKRLHLDFVVHYYIVLNALYWRVAPQAFQTVKLARFSLKNMYDNVEKVD